MFISKWIDKYRKEAYDLHVGTYQSTVSWRQAILEAIFRPEVKIPGKGDMTHLHPDTKKLHLPDNCYIADWRKYRVEDHPQLMNFQKRCHAQGLHDPWLRNYAWQYYPNTLSTKSVFAQMTYGIAWGLFFGTSVYIAERIYQHYVKVEPHPRYNWDSVAKDKPNSTRTYDEDGFMRRAACLCVRNDQEKEILLVTSSGDKDRWIVPGGGLEPNEESSAAAVREVMEEAGVVGRLGRCLGSFEQPDRKTRTSVYVLNVEEELKEWEEGGSRQRRWFKIDDALKELSVSRPAQSDYIKLLSKRMDDQNHNEAK